MKLVVAKWQDSVSFSQWAEVDFIDESRLKICYASGFLITEDKERVTIALLTSDDKTCFSNWINIPAGDVLELTVVREVDWEETDGD